MSGWGVVDDFLGAMNWLDLVEGWIRGWGMMPTTTPTLCRLPVSIWNFPNVCPLPYWNVYQHNLHNVRFFQVFNTH